MNTIEYLQRLQERYDFDVPNPRREQVRGEIKRHMYGRHNFTDDSSFQDVIDDYLLYIDRTDHLGLVRRGEYRNMPEMYPAMVKNPKYRAISAAIRYLSEEIPIVDNVILDNNYIVGLMVIGMNNNDLITHKDDLLNMMNTLKRRIKDAEHIGITNNGHRIIPSKGIPEGGWVYQQIMSATTNLVDAEEYMSQTAYHEYRQRLANVLPRPPPKPAHKS